MDNIEKNKDENKVENKNGIGFTLEDNMKNIITIFKNCEETGFQKYAMKEVFSGSITEDQINYIFNNSQKVDVPQTLEEQKISENPLINSSDNISIRTVELQNQDNNSETPVKNDNQDIENITLEMEKKLLTDKDSNNFLGKIQSEISVKNPVEDANKKIFDFIKNLEKGIRKKQEKKELMSQYKNYFRFIEKGTSNTTKSISFAFDPQEKNFICYDPNDKNFDKKKFLIVQPKGSPEKIRLNTQKDNKSEKNFEKKKNENDTLLKYFEEFEEDISFHSEHMEIKSYMFLNNLSKEFSNNLKITFGDVDLNKNKKESNFFKFCQEGNDQYYFFIIDFKKNKISNYHLFAISMKKCEAERDGYLSTKSPSTDFSDFITDYAYSPYKKLLNQSNLSFKSPSDNSLITIDGLFEKNSFQNVKKNTIICFECKCNNDIEKALFQLDRSFLDLKSIIKYNQAIGIICLSIKENDKNYSTFEKSLQNFMLIEKTFNVKIIVINPINKIYDLDVENKMELRTIIDKYSDLKYSEKISNLEGLIKNKDAEIQDLRIEIQGLRSLNEKVSLDIESLNKKFLKNNQPDFTNIILKLQKSVSSLQISNNKLLLQNISLKRRINYKKKKKKNIIS